MRHIAHPTLFAIALLFSACEFITGKELARLPVNAISTEGNVVSKEVEVPLKAHNEIAIWSHMDMAYDGDVQFHFRIEVLKDGKKIQTLEVDPTRSNVTLNETKRSFNGHTDWSFTAKNELVQVPEDGTYTFRAVLVASDTTGVKLRAAEVILKK